MVFSSPIFLFWFLPLVFLFYFADNTRFKNAILLIFSLLFYSWGEGKMVIILLISTAINFLCGLWIQDSRNEPQRKLLVVLSVIVNLGLLIYYKYGNFFADNYNLMATNLGLHPGVIEKIVLPLGISFYTFHGMSYVIDIYRRQATAQRDPLNMALYISFFPQLIAGPIVRYHEIAGQLIERNENLELFASGIKRFVTGLAKKVLIANYVALVAETVFSTPTGLLDWKLAWIGLLAVSIQIYFDFSGYSDMAVGLARIFGFRFPENFIYPLSSTSMKEFWTRWHITLSAWFRDYLYLPLGGSRKGFWRTQLNLWIIFLLMGFWHGAEWTFLAFGAWHGSFIVLERLGFEKILATVPKIFRNWYVWIIYFGGNIIFSSPDMSYALHFCKSLFSTTGDTQYAEAWAYIHPEFWFVLIVGILFNYPVGQKLTAYFKQNRSENDFLWTIGKWSAWAGYMILLWLSMTSMAGSTYNPFIYFRF